MKSGKLLYVFFGLFLLISCVPQRQMLDERARANAMEAERDACADRLKKSQAEEARLRESVNNLTKEATQLREDTAAVGQNYRKTLEMNRNLNELYEKVISQNKDLLSTSSSERQRLSLELTEKERQLERKTNELAQKERQLNEKEKNISALQSGLQDRERRVRELESLVNKKDSAVAALRNSVSRALMSFNENELTVNVKDGKVYVSLAEQLLFKSGSTAVDPKGREALNKVAEVLKRQPEIDIMVEGHTDNVPIKTASIKDNWDLSVLRATSIVRILTEDNGIESSRVVPTGRGEFMPVATNETREGKAKNRRTEIILSPKLDEIFRIIENK